MENEDLENRVKRYVNILEVFCSLKSSNNQWIILNNLKNLEEVRAFDAIRIAKLVEILEEQGVTEFENELFKESNDVMAFSLFRGKVNIDQIHMLQPIIKSLAQAYLLSKMPIPTLKQYSPKDLTSYRLGPLTVSQTSELFRFVGLTDFTNRLYDLNEDLEPKYDIMPTCGLSELTLDLMKRVNGHEDSYIEGALEEIGEIERLNELPPWILDSRKRVLQGKKIKLDLFKDAIKAGLYTFFGEPKKMRDEEVISIIDKIEEVYNTIFCKEFAEQVINDSTELINLMYNTSEGYFPLLDTCKGYFQEILEKTLQFDEPIRFSPCSISKLLTYLGYLNLELKIENEGLESLLENAAQLDQTNYKAPCYLSQIAAMHNEKNKMKHYLKLSIARVINNLKLQDKIKVINGSANTVFEIDLPEFKGLIFKEGDKKWIDKEFYKTKALFMLGKGYNYAEPSFIIPEEGDAAVLVLKKAKLLKENEQVGAQVISYANLLKFTKTTLEANKDIFNILSWTSQEEIDNLTSRNILAKAIDALAEMQIDAKKLEVENETFEEYNYHKVLEEKVLNKISLPAGLLSKAKNVADYLSQQDRYFSHCDYHLGNIVDIGQFKTCIIDFETASMANRFFDLAYLLEQIELGLTEKTKKFIIDQFVKKLGLKGEKVEENVQKLYDYNAAFVNLRIASAYSNSAKQKNDSSYQKYVDKHIEQANAAIKRLNI